MHFLFLSVIIIQFFSVTTGHTLDLYDFETWCESSTTKTRHKAKQDATPKIVEPANEEGFSLTRMVSAGFNQIKPALPIIAFFAFRYIQQCPDDCPIE